MSPCWRRWPTSKSGTDRRTRGAFAPAALPRTPIVIAGLDPAIITGPFRNDPRVKPGGDDPKKRPRLFRLERERRAVHAVAQPGRRRTVLEDMAEMAAALRAMHLHPAHEQAVVLGGRDAAFERREEARPAGAALELFAAAKERRAAGGAGESARALLPIERARSRAFGAVLAQH